MNALKTIATQLSRAVGVDIDVTIRGTDQFTFSTETVNADLEAICVAAFDGLLELDAPTEHDVECGSFVYMKVKV